MPSTKSSQFLITGGTDNILSCGFQANLNTSAVNVPRDDGLNFQRKTGAVTKNFVI